MNYIPRRYTTMLGHSIKRSNGKSVLLRPFTPFPGFKKQLSAVSSYVLSHHAAADRGQNHDNNTIREAIICAIINDRVPAPYYLTERWRALKNAVDGFLVKCGGNDYSHVECIPKGGRGHHYDFAVVFTYNRDDATTTKTFNVEFKFNAAKVSDAPQFVSLMKPSQYCLSGNYEESFYDKYMAKIASAAGCVAPDRTEWLKQIHNDKPPCVKQLKAMYYAGSTNSSQFTNLASDIAFHDLCITLSKESISTFITEHDLDTSKLSEYLIKSQEEKWYMLFQPATVSGGGGGGVPTITLQCVDPADYTIVSCKKNPRLSRYDCVTQSGKKMKVLLRWKNGNGIAFPAFQIS
jgi:hypothetical protein